MAEKAPTCESVGQTDYGEGGGSRCIGIYLTWDQGKCRGERPEEQEEAKEERPVAV